MGGFAQAVTNGQGLMGFHHDIKIGTGGHGTSKDNYTYVQFNHSQRTNVFYLANKTLRHLKIYEALKELGVSDAEEIAIQDTSKLVPKTGTKKDGTPMEPGRSRASHYAVDVTIKSKRIRVMIGNEILKIGIMTGDIYKFYRGTGQVNKLINSRKK